jgi:phosphatidylinositol-3-phosphatase
MAASKILLTVLLLVPAAAAEGPLFRFVQISDTHIGMSPDRATTLNEIVAHINAGANLPAFVLITGDLTENGLASEYTEFKSIMAKLNPAVARHYVPGNHETVSGTWADYEANIGPLTHSFTVQNCLFVLTNGTRNDQTYHHDGFIDSAQLQWIENELKGSLTKTHVVMANHFPLGTQWGLYSVVDPAMSTIQGWMRDYKVTAWLNGHRHFDAFYADATYETSHILCGATTGASGFAGPGYRLNTVYPDRIVSERVKMYSGSDPRFVEPAPYVSPNPRPAVATPPPPATTLPRPDHVVIVVEENKSYSQIIGSPLAPYVNSLAAQGALFSSSYALVHPSQPNYLALFSGSTQGVVDSTCPPPGSPYTTPNLGAALLAKGLTFAGYSEDLPAIGSTVCNNLQYWRKHNPWVNWQGTGTNQLPPSVNLRYLDFPANYADLPTLSFVIPNQDHDMHDGATRIETGDAWLQANLDSYVQWAKTHNSLFILTFDEDDESEGNRIVTLFVGPMVKPGQYAQTIDHYDVLRTLEDLYGLSHSGAAASATPIENVWGSAPTPTAPSKPAPRSDGLCGALGLEGVLLAWLGRRCLRRGRRDFFRF